MGLSEMRRIMLAERVVNTYRSMAASDLTTWQTEHPADFAFMTTAITLYEKMKHGRHG